MGWGILNWLHLDGKCSWPASRRGGAAPGLDRLFLFSEHLVGARQSPPALDVVGLFGDPLPPALEHAAPDGVIRAVIPIGLG